MSTKSSSSSSLMSSDSTETHKNREMSFVIVGNKQTNNTAATSTTTTATDSNAGIDSIKASSSSSQHPTKTLSAASSSSHRTSSSTSSHHSSASGSSNSSSSSLHPNEPSSSSGIPNNKRLASSSSTSSSKSTASSTTTTTSSSSTTASTTSSNATTPASTTNNTPPSLTKEQELELIKELCGDEMCQLLQSSKHQDREEFLTRLNTWINQSSNLSHGFMVFPSVTLPIEKSKVLKVFGIILKMVLVDKIIKIVQIAYSTCILLVESAPVQQAKNVTHLKEGLSHILPLLMTKVIDSNERNSKSAIQALTKMSTVKVISKLVFNYSLQSINAGKALSPKAIQGRISLVDSLVLKHGLKETSSFEISVQFLDFLNECLTHKTVQVKDSCIDLLVTMHKSMGKELFDSHVLDKLHSKSSALIQKLDIKIRAKKHEELEEERKKEELKNQKTQNETNLVFKQGDISRELIMKKSLKKMQSGESIRSFLKSLTHLHFDSCNIGKIVNLEHCPNLRVLYLYDNRITKIEGLSNNKQLIHLHLHHNLIEKIEGLDELVNLQQLYLNNNRIKVVEGLEKLQKLQELHLQQQDIETPMQISSDSMKALSNSLSILFLSNNKIEDALAVGFLENLIELDLSRNRISQIDQVLFILESNRQLHSLNLLGNAVCGGGEPTGTSTLQQTTNSYKVRDQIILASSLDLTLLNQVEITDIQREFLLSFENQKKKSVNGGGELMKQVSQQPQSNHELLKDLLTINQQYHAESNKYTLQL